MGEQKMDTTQIRWNVVNKPYIVLLKNMALSGTPFFLWITLRDLESWNYGALSFSFLCLWAGQFFYSIAPCLLPLKNLRDMRRTWLEYLFWRAIFVGRIRSRICGQQDVGSDWWRNVWQWWMLGSNVELSLSRHGKASNEYKSRWRNDRYWDVTIP